MAEEKMTPRVRPHSEEAEQAVLGSLLMGRDPVDTGTEIFEAEDFFKARHRVIYRGMQDLYRENRAIDLITLKDRLEQGGTLETIGGLVYLGQIAAAVPSSVNAKHYAQIVKDKAQDRRVDPEELSDSAAHACDRTIRPRTVQVPGTDARGTLRIHGRLVSLLPGRQLAEFRRIAHLRHRPLHHLKGNDHHRR